MQNIFNTYDRKNKIIYAILVVIIILSITFIFFPVRSTATPAISLFNFGGPILLSQTCTCSSGQLIVVGPPVPGIFVLQLPLSVGTVFPFGQLFRPGPWVLGSYTPGGICLIGVPPFCTSLAQPKGTILTVGTSM